MSRLRIVWAGLKKYRKRRRNFTVVLIGSYFLLFFFIAVFSTINENLWLYWVENFVGGDLIVRREVDHYDLFNPISSEYYFSYGEFLKVNPLLQDRVTPRLRVGALLEGRESGASTACVLIGVDLEKEKRLNDHICVTDGQLFASGTKGIILPETVAANLGAQLGDEIIIYLVTEDGYLNYDLLTVTGFLKLSSAAVWFGQNIGYLPLDFAREMVMTGEDTVSELLYASGAANFAVGWQRNGYRRVNGLTSFSMVRALYLAFRFLSLVLYILVFAFTLSIVYHNVVLINTERVREIGVYLTYGASPFWLRRLFLLELTLYTAY